MKKKLSPYDLPQSNDNPMRPLLAEVIDFDRLRLQEEIQLTVSATDARTARRRIFTKAKMLRRAGAKVHQRSW